MCIPIDSTIKPTMEQIQSSRPFRAKSLRLRLRRLRSLRWFHLLQIPWPTEFEAAKMVAITCSSGGPHLRASDLHMDWRLYIYYIYIFIYIYIYVYYCISVFNNPFETCELIDWALVQPVSVQRCSRPETTLGAEWPPILWCLKNRWTKNPKEWTKTIPNRPWSSSTRAPFDQGSQLSTSWALWPISRLPAIADAKQHGHLISEIEDFMGWFFAELFNQPIFLYAYNSAQMGCSPIFGGW